MPHLKIKRLVIIAVLIGIFFKAISYLLLSLGMDNTFAFIFTIVTSCILAIALNPLYIDR